VGSWDIAINIFGSWIFGILILEIFLCIFRFLYQELIHLRWDLIGKPLNYAHGEMTCCIRCDYKLNFLVPIISFFNFPSLWKANWVQSCRTPSTWSTSQWTLRFPRRAVISTRSTTRAFRPHTGWWGKPRWVGFLYRWNGKIRWVGGFQ